LKGLRKGRHWELVRPDEPKDAPRESLTPAEQQVRVALESRKKGKVVTVVSGLVLARDEIRALAGELKALCGAGGTAGDGSVELQGDHRDAVRRHLVELGYRVG
jgi:translation initiation factor 1